MALLDVVKYRKSVRDFLNRPVELTGKSRLSWDRVMVKGSLFTNWGMLKF
jgi:hypothetical protein